MRWPTRAGSSLCASAAAASAAARAARAAVELVADAGHELRGPLCAARLGLHGLDDAARAGRSTSSCVGRRWRSTTSSPRRGGRARGRGRSSWTSARCSDDGAEAWRAARGGVRRLARRSSRCAGARSSAPTRCGSRRRAATSWPTRVEHGGAPVRVRAPCDRRAGADRGRRRRPGPARSRSAALIARRAWRRAARSWSRDRARIAASPRRSALLRAERPRSLPRARAPERRRRPEPIEFPWESGTYAPGPRPPFPLRPRHPPDPARPALVGFTRPAPRPRR